MTVVLPAPTTLIGQTIVCSSGLFLGILNSFHAGKLFHHHSCGLTMRNKKDPVKRPNLSIETIFR